MPLYPSPPRCGIAMTCTHFSQCALDQGNGGWATLANNPRYGIQKLVFSNLKEDPWLDPLALEFLTSNCYEFQLPSSIGLPTFFLLSMMAVDDFYQGHWTSVLIHLKMDDPFVRIFCIHQRKLFSSLWSVLHLSLTCIKKHVSFPLVYKPTK